MLFVSSYNRYQDSKLRMCGAIICDADFQFELFPALTCPGPSQSYMSSVFKYNVIKSWRRRGIVFWFGSMWMHFSEAQNSRAWGERQGILPVVWGESQRDNHMFARWRRQAGSSGKMFRLWFILLLLVSLSECLKRVSRLSSPFEGNLGWKLEEIDVADYVKGSVWPKPQQLTQADGVVFSLDPTKFQFVSVGESSDVLSAALLRYKHITFPLEVKAPPKETLQEIATLSVKVMKKYENLSLESDESCKYFSSFSFPV